MINIKGPKNPENHPKNPKNNPAKSMILWVDYFDWIVNQ